ncbi:hypothetical protein DFA_00657 [Cavenderia fasciculata]|uniref:F-box domain-containing protein n=1 Tax=Cavenderia fasciculata TaxID=261658 RepID=F4PT03_CACFS|nr:uncharacterized protein DFA_00657 [Cavenderia fasciculata]EGG20792.1 hypothetical protein DFA_00657 [Cavenderia fasciculata]|eukprot:XP_004358642.1 hypothetical protein DFA_00657 [Cavenderia fasciculata]
MATTTEIDIEDYITTKIPTTIVLEILNHLDNVDLICMLLTCKKLYFNIRQQCNNTIRFKDIRLVDEKAYNYIWDRFVDKMGSCMPSFYNILQNTLSNQLVIADQQNEYASISKRFNNYHILDNNDVMSANSTYYNTKVETALLSNVNVNTIGDWSKLKLPTSTTTILIHHGQTPIEFPTDYFHHLPLIKRMVVECSQISLGGEGGGSFPQTIKSLDLKVSSGPTKELLSGLPHGLESLVFRFGRNTAPIPFQDIPFNKMSSSLTTLELYTTDLPPGILPTSLTRLTLSFNTSIPQDLFKSLTRLESLSIIAKRLGKQDQPVDLQPLVSLKSFKTQFGPAMQFMLPQESLQHLTIDSFTKIDSIPESLTSLNISLETMVHMLESEMHKLPTSLTKLKLNTYIPRLIPPGLIPNTIKYLQIEACTLVEGSIPASVETLKVGESMTENVTLPDTIKHLSWKSEVSVPLPKQLETLEWTCNLLRWADKAYDYSHNFAPIISQLPTTLTSLAIQLPNFESLNNDQIRVYSLLDNIKSKTNDGDDDDDNNDDCNQLILPPHVTQLTCNIPLWFEYLLCFRLDEIINRTNVQELTLSFPVSHWVQLVIKRLDNDNSNVMIVENNSILGGFIQQQPGNLPNQKYRPLYIQYHYDQRGMYTFLGYELPTNGNNNDNNNSNEMEIPS